MKTMDNNKQTGANSSVGMETTSEESAKVKSGQGKDSRFAWLAGLFSGWMSWNKAVRKAVIYLVCALACVVAGVVIVKCYADKDDDLQIQETMLTINEIKLKGEIYVCSALIEDYTVKRKTEKRLLLSDKEHSCIQTLTQKCSYKIDLSEVGYLVNDSIGVVYVRMPDIQYVATTQKASFISDDSQYWAENMPNTNAMKKTVEQQIRHRFDTPNNRRKAQRYAEDAIIDMLSKLGYQTEFFNTVEDMSVE